ncbi:phage baseplate assembly protein V [Streptomyces sp. HMX87]|uniref:phage baseplate assembly protein V n=1 Tax=Streptomyces sp. HMX87 TaxID=3390849 RepID=UPI003A8C7611
MSALHGVYAGLVVATDDPLKRRRVRVRIPQLTGTMVSGWAEPVSYGIAAPGDKVTVAFEGGDLNYPVYWPRAESAWRPLALRAGWTKSWLGDPVYRLTQDGMVELSGSVETSGAIPLGAPVVFADLPLGARPLEGYHAPVATSYYTAYNSRTAHAEYRFSTSTTSATYVTDSNGPSVSFISPASGEAVVFFVAQMQNNTATGRSLMSVRVLQGSSVIAEADDHRSAEVQGPDNATAAGTRQITGMTPGSTYTVTAVYRTEGASSTASFDNKSITVIPVGQHDTPAARIQMQNNGVIAATFPAGTAPPYDLSLTGIRARII